jgi:hypothetical protein
MIAEIGQASSSFRGADALACGALSLRMNSRPRSRLGCALALPLALLLWAGLAGLALLAAYLIARLV